MASSSEIKKGDLVMVVRGTKCCGNEISIGKTFIVSEIKKAALLCRRCGVVAEETVVMGDAHLGRVISRLRRIDPPTEGEYDGVPVRKRVPRKEVA